MILTGAALAGGFTRIFRGQFDAVVDQELRIIVDQRIADLRRLRF